MPDVIVRALGTPPRTVNANTPAGAVGKTEGSFRVNRCIIENPETYQLSEGDVVDHSPALKAAS